MHTSQKTCLAGSGALVATALLQTVALAQQPFNAQPPRLIEAPVTTEPVVVDGIEFESWLDYLTSDYFKIANKRCGTPPEAFIAADGEDGGLAGGSTADCDGSTNPSAIYSPAGIKYRIPVVFHSITSGATGTLADFQIQANINVLNEDYKAMPGTPGQLGNTAQIEFFLTDDFPTALAGGTTSGNGIMRYNNATWYNDGGSYYNSIARSPAFYLNIYANSAGGALGYVPFLPFSSPGSIGSSADRVVLWLGAVGDPCPVGGVYCTGRSATHEIGHYLNLLHVFQSCGTTTSPGCYSSGDLICDTSAKSNPSFGCPAPTSQCADGGPDPVRNYMDYTDDTCMTNFSIEQTRRMRCTLEHYRPLLPVQVAIFPGNFTSTPNNLGANSNIGGTTLCDNKTQTGRSDGAGDTLGAYTGNAFVLAGDEVAYRINHSGGDLEVKLTGLNADLDLMLLTSAGTPASTFEVSNNGGTANERIVAQGLSAGTYYAVVDTFTVSAHSVYGSNFVIRYTRCVADINDDNVVNVSDLLAVISAWGSCATCDEDVTGDDQVNVADLLTVIGAWGPCP